MTLIRWENKPSMINEIDHFFNNFRSDFFTTIKDSVWTPNFEILNIIFLRII